MSDALMAARAKHNALRRYRHPTDPAVKEARADLAAEALAAYIQKTIRLAGPLSSDQRDRLSLLLSGGASKANA